MKLGSINGQVVFFDGVRPAVVSFDIESGTIVSVENAESDAVDGRLLFPGFMDIHVHAREYPRPQEGNAQDLALWKAFCSKETFATAGEAAINGGVTRFCAMPNDPIPPSDARSYSRKKAISAASPCPVVLFSVVTADSEPWEDVPYKVYLDHSPSSVSFTRWRDLECALDRYRGRRVFFHAEDPDILRAHAGDGPRWLTRPPEAEIRAVEKILEMTTGLGLKSHICHVSTRAAVELITDYNRSGEALVTCEVTPHHLFFSVDSGKVCCPGGEEVPHRTRLGYNPPLRSESDRRYLLEALRDGRIHALASDHAPHTLEDKMRGAPGVPHLDTLGPFAGWLIKECGFSPTRIAEALSVSPGSIFSADMEEKHGSIEPGAAASFTLLDLTGSTVVEGDRIRGRGPMKTRCGWSAFDGFELPASVTTTVVQGREHHF